MIRSRASTLPTVAVLVLTAAWAGCSQGYNQGDCDPGYLKVKGECVLAVGQDCQRNRDCLANICLVDPETTSQFCSIECVTQESCPTGFYCSVWSDRRCYPGQRPLACQLDDDCAACQACVDGACQSETGCITCAADAECAGCQRCVEGECTDVAGCQVCSQDAECETCEICAERGQCERLPGCQLCAIDSDCPGCTRCDRSACVPIDGCGTDPCFNDLDCPARTACLWDAGTGITVCLPTGLAFGEDCSRGGDPTCAGGICLVEPTNLEATCSSACLVDEDCPLGTACEPDSECLWACRSPTTPPPGAACLSDADCPADRLCGLVADLPTGVWETRCVERLVCAAEAGQDCGPLTSGRCEGGMCADFDLCSAVCAAHGDCPIQSLCVQLALDLSPDGPSAAFWGCAPAELARFEIGQPCPSGDDDCREGLCAPAGTTGPTPRCTNTCTPGAAECPDGLACLTDPLDAQRDLCLPAVQTGDCVADADCPQDEVCRLLAATGVPACGPPGPGAAEPGEACALDADCRHGACGPAGLCRTPCADAGDCPPGLTCDVRRWPRPDGAAGWARVCAAPPGSMAPCRSDLPCQAGEVCRPELSWRLTGLEGRCAPTGSGAGEGEACLGPAGCQTGACTEQSICTRLCEQDADCQDAARVCAPLSLVGPTGRTWTTRACRPAPVGLGEPCPGGDNDCASGLCHVPAEGEAYCTRECMAHEDCAAVEGMTCVADASGTTCRR